MFKKFIFLIIPAILLFSGVNFASAFDNGDPVLCIKKHLVNQSTKTIMQNTLFCKKMSLGECKTNICQGNEMCLTVLNGIPNVLVSVDYLLTPDWLGQQGGSKDSVEPGDTFYGPALMVALGNKNWYQKAQEWRLDAGGWAIADAKDSDFKDCPTGLTTKDAKDDKRSTRACCINYGSDSKISSCQARPSPCLYTPNSYVEQHPLGGSWLDDVRGTDYTILDGDGLAEKGIYSSTNACQTSPLQPGDETSKDPTAIERWKKLSEACCLDSSVGSQIVDQCKTKINVDDAGINQSVATTLGLYDTNIPNTRTTIYFRPTVGIPGTDFSTGALVKIDSSTFGKFLGQFFGFALSVVAIMAILMIIIAGATMYFKAAKGDINGAAKAKDQIKGAILGLVFTLAAVTIFRFISPRLVEIPSLTTQNIAVNLTDKFAYTEADVENESDGGKSSGSTACKNTTYGDALTEATKQQVSFTLKTKNSQTTISRVHKKIIPALEKVNQALASVDYKIVKNSGGYYYKVITGSKFGSLSNHSWGIAIDINADTNKQYVKATNSEVQAWRSSHSGYNANCPTDMPEAFVKAFTSNGFAWGGAWKSTCDAMHFEYISDCGGTSSSSSSGGTISQCIPSAETGNTVSETTSNQELMKDVFATINIGVENSIPASSGFNDIKESIKSVAKAQAVLESGWGSSNAAGNHNYFGIKCVNVDPANCDANKKYRSYSSDAVGIADYLAVLSKWSGQLSEVKTLSGGKLKLDNPCNVAYYVIQGPSRRWATDPNYGQKVADVINKYFGACTVDKSLQNVIKGVCS